MLGLGFFCFALSIGAVMADQPEINMTTVSISSHSKTDATSDGSIPTRSIQKRSVEDQIRLIKVMIALIEKDSKKDDSDEEDSFLKNYAREMRKEVLKDILKNMEQMVEEANADKKSGKTRRSLTDKLNSEEEVDNQRKRMGSDGQPLPTDDAGNYIYPIVDRTSHPTDYESETSDEDNNEAANSRQKKSYNDDLSNAFDNEFNRRAMEILNSRKEKTTTREPGSRKTKLIAAVTPEAQTTITSSQAPPMTTTDPLAGKIKLIVTPEMFTNNNEGPNLGPNNEAPLMSSTDSPEGEVEVSTDIFSTEVIIAAGVAGSCILIILVVFFAFKSLYRKRNKKRLPKMPRPNTPKNSYKSEPQPVPAQESRFERIYTEIPDRPEVDDEYKIPDSTNNQIPEFEAPNNTDTRPTGNVFVNILAMIV